MPAPIGNDRNTVVLNRILSEQKTCGIDVSQVVFHNLNFTSEILDYEFALNKLNSRISKRTNRKWLSCLGLTLS